MLDAGLDLEPEYRGIVQQLRDTKRCEWSQKLLAQYKAGLSATTSGVAYKTTYGSLYPYRDISPYSFSYKNVEARTSYAKGGLSTVWGSSLRIYQPKDFQGWPITFDDIAPYYKEISSFMPFSGSVEALNILGRDSGLPMQDLKMSRQIGSLVRDSSRFIKEFDEAGCIFDCSKLAIQAPRQGGDGCVYCGLCIYGCPYGYIFNSATVIREMQKNKRFQYRAGVFVESLSESGNEARITARGVISGEKEVYLAEKVFLGTGVLSTARILLQSYEMYDRTLTCLDSQYFLLPSLSFKRTKGICEEDLHTLTQLCVSLNSSMGQGTAFLQIYGYNDLFEGLFRRRDSFTRP